MKGIKVKEEQDVQIDLDITSYIPDTYIEDSSQKIDIYQKIALCRTEEDIENVIDEIIDRFGNMPEELNNLIEVARIKNMCKKANVLKISEKKNRVTGSQNVVFYFDKDKFDPNVITTLLKKYGTKIRRTSESPIKIGGNMVKILCQDSFFIAYCLLECVTG